MTNNNSSEVAYPPNASGRLLTLCSHIMRSYLEDGENGGVETVYDPRLDRTTTRFTITSPKGSTIYLSVPEGATEQIGTEEPGQDPDVETPVTLTYSINSLSTGPDSPRPGYTINIYSDGHVHAKYVETKYQLAHETAGPIEDAIEIMGDFMAER